MSMSAPGSRPRPVPTSSAAREAISSNQTGAQATLVRSGCCLANSAHCKSSNISHHYQNQSQCTTTTAKTGTQQYEINQSNRFQGGNSPLERCFTLLLPLIFVFLLPTIKLTPIAEEGRSRGSTTASHGASLLETGHLFGSASGAASDLLLALIRFPFDKIRLQSASLVLAAATKEVISSKSDLQEEETNMMLLAPAEHRSSYAPPGGGHQAAGYHYNPDGGDSGGPQHGGEAHAQAMPVPGGADYGPDSIDQSAGSGQSESTVVAESTSGPLSSTTALQTRSDLPAVRALNVKCEKNHMTVNIVFDRPFFGMVFSKGHYNDQKCVHLPPNSGQTSINFDIHLGKCGMSSSDGGGTGLLQQAGSERNLEQRGSGSQQPNGVFIENTIIIQYDPLVQEIYDQARKLRCTWYDYYEKSVTFRPYNVDMLDAVTANFLGDNIQCWMQIQVGKGPWSSEVAGIVKIGQTMTMVLAIKDDENRFDMLVRNCVAHDGKHQPIQLVDEYGCVARPKIMGKFQKVRNFGPAATVVSYAHFQAFKFPDSMNVHFQCVIQVCRYECPEPVCQQPVGVGELAAGSGGSPGSSPGGGGGAPPGDYATSGTEMIASKELGPHHQQAGGGPFNPTMSGATSANLSSAHHHNHHGSNVNLKLDESQGRVQVKLDTSMLTGLGNNGRPPVAAGAPQAGPLPPHLLHAGQQQQQQEHLRQSYMSAGFYRPPVSPSQTVGLNIAQARHPSSVLTANTAAGSMGGRSASTHEQQIVSYSPQFPTAAASRRSAAYTTRLGEMASNDENGATGGGQYTQTKIQQQLQHPLDQLAPYEAEYPLSLIASPRGLQLGSMIGGGTGDPLSRGQRPSQHLHRVKRAEASEATPAATIDNNDKRQSRHLRAADSTSVQTHKSIQVVSPDDVAFSLLDLDENQTGTITTVAGTSRRKMTAVDQASSSVCFSASRFLWAALVTLTALISGIVIVTYVILRQRSQLEEKLSTVYSVDQFQPPQGMSFNYQASMVSQGTSAQLQQSASGTNDLGAYLHPGNTSAATAVALERQMAQQTICSANNNNIKRQQEEVHQRNKYLARLYSQFSPASYWR